MNRLAYSITETAKLLGVSRSTIYKLIDGEQLKVMKIGRLRRISLDEINRFLKSKEE